jgi:hypothetical protein
VQDTRKVGLGANKMGRLSLGLTSAEVKLGPSVQSAARLLRPDEPTFKSLMRSSESGRFC